MRKSSKTTTMMSPQCQQCGERDRVVLIDGCGGAGTHDYFCDRCVCNVAASSPPPGRYTPDDVGPALVKRKRRPKKSSTPALVKAKKDRTEIRKICQCGHDWLSHPFNGTERACINATCQCHQFADAAMTAEMPDGRAAP